ncbi:hypothetical protein QCA50_015473 [Cerrena zonata]|uniref:Uncharacterized protein n=1 Tax=Cerrena zonata TaxID=2478898 RepID=A0AAW0FL96_9APHY
MVQTPTYQFFHFRHLLRGYQNPRGSPIDLAIVLFALTGHFPWVFPALAPSPRGVTHHPVKSFANQAFISIVYIRYHSSFVCALRKGGPPIGLRHTNSSGHY